MSKYKFVATIRSKSKLLGIPIVYCKIYQSLEDTKELIIQKFDLIYLLSNNRPYYGSETITYRKQ